MEDWQRIKNAAGFGKSPFYPRSPYGAAKIYGFGLLKLP
jgi:GDP-D-mannose dehydratase